MARRLKTPFAELDLVFATEESVSNTPISQTVRPIWLVIEVKSLGVAASAMGAWVCGRMSREQFARQVRAMDWIRQVHVVDVEWRMALVTRDGKVDWIRDFGG